MDLCAKFQRDWEKMKNSTWGIQKDNSKGATRSDRGREHYALEDTTTKNYAPGGIFCQKLKKTPRSMLVFLTIPRVFACFVSKNCNLFVVFSKFRRKGRAQSVFKKKPPEQDVLGPSKNIPFPGMQKNQILFPLVAPMFSSAPCILNRNAEFKFVWLCRRIEIECVVDSTLDFQWNPLDTFWFTAHVLVCHTISVRVRVDEWWLVSSIASWLLNHLTRDLLFRYCAVQYNAVLPSNSAQINRHLFGCMQENLLRFIGWNKGFHSVYLHSCSAL